ncbi:MAG: T9SS type A sorting domain-containing protein, partial [Bacteroidota bacterium]
LLMIGGYLSVSSVVYGQYTPYSDPIRTKQGEKPKQQYYDLNERINVTRSTLEDDWTSVGTLTPNPFSLNQGFKAVGDSIIFASVFDLRGFFGITTAPERIFGKSMDEGETWTPIEVTFADSSLLNTGDSLLSIVNIFPVNESVIYSCLNQMPAQTYGILAKTLDGGDSWERLPYPKADEREIPLELHFWGPDTGVVFSNGFPPIVPVPVQIYYTEDGGENFLNVSPPLDSAESRWVGTAQTLKAVSGDTIWYGTRNGRVLRSVNKGLEWEVIETGLEPETNVLSFAFKESSLEGLASFEGGPDGFPVPSFTMRTLDGGNTWKRLSAPTIIETLAYVEGSGGVFLGTTGAFGRPGHIISKDNGNSWAYVLTSPAGAAAYFPNPEFGLIGEIGFAGGIFKYRGTPLTYDENFASELSFTGEVFPTLPDGYVVQDIDAVDDNLVWAVANSQSAGFPVDSSHSPYSLKSTDGGETWEVIPMSDIMGRVSLDIYVFDENIAWITSLNRSMEPVDGVWVTTDGGQTWTEKLSGPEGAIWIHWFDPQEGIVINRDLISRTIDGGETWDNIPQEGLPAYYTEEFNVLTSAENSKAIVGDNIWIGTNAGRVFRSKDRGLSWEGLSILPDSNGIVCTLAFQDEDNGIAGIPFNTQTGPRFVENLFRTTDGGDTWEALPPFLNYHTVIEYVPGTESTYIIGSDWDQYLAYTTDGGDSWITFRDIGSFDAIDFANNETGFLADRSPFSEVIPPLKKYSGDAFPAKTSVSITEDLASLGIKVFPNPVIDEVSIQSEEPMTYIGLIDIQGRKVPLVENLSVKQWSGNLSHYPSGHYWVEIIISGKGVYKLIELH